MTYTKKREQQEAIIKFSIGQKSSRTYFLMVYYEPGMKGWSVALYQTDSEKSTTDEYMIAEIVSKKWQLVRILDEEDYESLEEISEAI